MIHTASGQVLTVGELREMLTGAHDLDIITVDEDQAIVGIDTFGGGVEILIGKAGVGDALAEFVLAIYDGDVKGAAIKRRATELVRELDL